MKTKKRTEIECLARLNELTGGIDEILAFLLEERVITVDEAKHVKTSSNIPQEMQQLLKNLGDASRIQLLEYEWIILPVERVKILMVTNMQSREFTYNF